MYSWRQVASLYGAGGLLPCLFKCSFIGVFYREIFSINILCLFALCLPWLNSDVYNRFVVLVLLSVYGCMDDLDDASGFQMGVL